MREMIVKVAAMGLLILLSGNVFAKERPEGLKAEERNAVTAERETLDEIRKDKFIKGYDGGMLLHTGYAFGTIDEIGTAVSGAPLGVGGTLRVHLGRHFRIGSKGCISTLRQRKNGSFIKYGYGGLVGDFYWTLGRFMPYIGTEIGGGSRTTFMMDKNDMSSWEPADNAVAQKSGFFELSPYIGTDIILTNFVHLTLMADYMVPVSGGHLIAPSGPRFYIGFIFYH